MTQVQAQNFNKKSSLTFSHPVAVPGMTLSAGKYTFTQHESIGHRNVVQIWSEDSTKLITTILAIPNYRLERTAETVVEFHERPTGTPQALKAWFYPGDKYGIEFVYPRKEAIQIAQAANEVVLAETIEPTPSTLESVPLVAITPQQKEEPIEQSIQTAPAAETSQSVSVAKVLPRTASPIPLIALLGAISLAIGLGFRRFGTKTS